MLSIAQTLQNTIPRTAYKPPDLSMLLRRLMAFLFDWFVGLAIFNVIIKLCILTLSDMTLQDLAGYDTGFHIRRELVVLIYFMGSWVAPWRATPGMFLFRLQVVNEIGATLKLLPAFIRYFLFSLWFLYFNRRYFVFILGIEMGIYTLEEAQRIIYGHSWWFTGIKILLMLVLFLIPYSYLGVRTLPDYLSGARVVNRDRTTAA